MRRMFVVLAVVGAMFASAYGAAASLGVNAGYLGSGTDTLTSCDLDGVTVGYNLNASDPTVVDSFAVSGIAAACVGGKITVDSNDSDPVTNGPTISGTSETVDCDPNSATTCNAVDISSVTVTIVGP